MTRYASFVLAAAACLATACKDGRPPAEPAAPAGGTPQASGPAQAAAAPDVPPAPPVPALPPAAYYGRIQVPEANLLEQARSGSPVLARLRAGHVVGVMSEYAMRAQEPDGIPYLRVRHGAFEGWLRGNEVERLRNAPADPRGAWEALRTAMGAAAPAAACTPVFLLADVGPGEGEELVVYAPAPAACARALGVFEIGATTTAGPLAWMATGEVIDVRIAPYPGRPAFLDVLSRFVQGMRVRGETRTWYRVAGAAPGPLVPVFEAVVGRQDDASIPHRLETSRFGFPVPARDGRWLIQWRTTTRFGEGEDAKVLSSEQFYAYDGDRFVKTVAPAGVPSLDTAGK